jgi:hypothetical protein
MSSKDKGFQLPTDDIFYYDDSLDGTDICVESGYAWHLPKMVGHKGTSIDNEEWNGTGMASRIRRWPGQNRDK